MIKIALCDDQMKTTSYIEEMVLDLSKRKSIDVEVDVFFDGQSLVKNIRFGDVYDLIYLDIEMKIMNGVETAKKIREFDGDVILIYVSGHENYWKDLFEVEPFRFISKPIDELEFANYFYKACEKVQSMNVFFEFKYNREFLKVKINDIIYFESCKRTIYIFTNKGEEFKFYGKLNEVETTLREKNSHFLRIHQSNLVNYKFVKKIGTDFVILSDDTQLIISGERQKEIRKKYCDLIGDDISE